MSTETFTVIITRPNYWYHNLKGLIFDVKEFQIREGRMVYRLEVEFNTIASLLRPEVDHFSDPSVFLGMVETRKDSRDQFWIEPTDCVRMSNLNNHELRTLLHETPTLLDDTLN